MYLIIILNSYKLKINNEDHQILAVALIICYERINQSNV